MNKIFLSFCKKDELDECISKITTLYYINRKIFVFECNETDEFLITYNLDNVNINSILRGTISLHRNKEYNVLYTINALNIILKNKNLPINKNIQINWSEYKNSILITSNNNLRQLNTSIYKIIN